mgnify:CR=1 FL=1
MPALPADVALIDDMHLGQPHVIATYLLRGDAPAIVDPGPASTIDTLAAGLAAEGLRFEDLHAILLTHIHLDHAGATGVLLRRFPHLRVYVHARGAPHLADPSKLIVSATRLYGDAMERLWGEIVPVPAQAMTTLSGGEELQLAGRRLRVFDAPGHASHHVVYFDQASGAVWMGDNGGVCMPGLPVPRPATPPPDIDIDAWLRTLDTVGALGPRSLLLTHFGPTYEPAAYLADYRAEHTQTGTKISHLLGIPMIVSSIPTAFVNPLGAAALFGVGWGFQLVGHYVFEKNDPSFLSDPVYLLIGVLWVLFGYSMAFGNSVGGAGIIGNPFEFAGLESLLTNDPEASYPALAFVAFQACFAIITVALVSGAIADRASFAFDETGEFAFTSGYGITLKAEVQEAPKYILGLLNSRVLDFFIRQVSTPLRGGFFRYFTQFLEKLPIRTISFVEASRTVAQALNVWTSTSCPGGESSSRVSIDVRQLPPVDCGNVETKLDLALAYIDMDDPLGAKSLLEEVLQEGGSSQRSRAQALLERLAS